MTEPAGPGVLGALVAEHLTPILYALEVCAVSMHEAGRLDEARYYRALARQLANAGTDQGEGAKTP